MINENSLVVTSNNNVEYMTPDNWNELYTGSTDLTVAYSPKEEDSLESADDILGFRVENKAPTNFSYTNLTSNEKQIAETNLINDYTDPDFFEYICSDPSNISATKDVQTLENFDLSFSISMDCNRESENGVLPSKINAVAGIKAGTEYILFYSVSEKTYKNNEVVLAKILNSLSYL